MQRRSGIPASMAQVIQGLIVLAILASGPLRYYKINLRGILGGRADGAEAGGTEANGPDAPPATPSVPIDPASEPARSVAPETAEPGGVNGRS